MTEKQYRLKSAVGYNLNWSGTSYNWAAFEVTFEEITATGTPQTQTFNFGKLASATYRDLYAKDIDRVTFTDEVTHVKPVYGWTPDLEGLLFKIYGDPDTNAYIRIGQDAVVAN